MRGGWQSFNDALRAGEILAEIKGAVGHERWLTWLKPNTKINERTAQNYMRIFYHRDELKHIDDLTDAYDLLSGADEPEPRGCDVEDEEDTQMAKGIQIRNNFVFDRSVQRANSPAIKQRAEDNPAKSLEEENRQAALKELIARAFESETGGILIRTAEVTVAVAATREAPEQLASVLDWAKIVSNRMLSFRQKAAPKKLSW